MGQVVPLFSTFSAGMRRDEPRELMPRAACWNLVDYLPDILGSPIAKRGGWEYASVDISLTRSTASYTVAGSWAPFTAGAQNVTIDEDGELYTISPAGTVTDRGAALAPVAHPVFHRQQLIIPSSDGTAAPYVYAGVAPALLGGTPPSGRFPTVYKDRTVLAGPLATPQRIFFSDAGNPAGWDTVNAWIDATYPVTAIAGLSNSVLVFTREFLERIRGSTPPPGSDMIHDDHFYEQGCIDARSVAVADDLCWWCDTSGVYRTDGAETEDVTVRGGMKRYWGEVLSAYTSAWTVSAGFIRNWYTISILNGSTFVDAFMIDKTSRAWVRVSNLPSLMFWSSVGSADETFFADRSASRVGRLSAMFVPVGANKLDGDGDAVAPVYESPFAVLGGAKARVRNAYLTYDLRDAAGDDPQLTLGYITSPEQTSYTAAGDMDGTALTLPETTAMSYQRRWVREDAHGIAVRVTQSNPSAQTRLYSVATDSRGREQTRVS